jgi:hypothetical protein
MSSRMRLLITSLLTIALAGLLGVPGALADPVGNPGAQVITMTCDGAEYEFAVRHAGRSDNHTSAHLTRSTAVGSRLMSADVEVYVDGQLDESFSLDFHHGTVGEGVGDDRLVPCANVVDLGDGTTLHIVNWLVFSPDLP